MQSKENWTTLGAGATDEMQEKGEEKAVQSTTTEQREHY